MLSWMAGNCRNRTDPLTGKSFSAADDAYLSSIVRLHNNTCTAAPPCMQRSLQLTKPAKLQHSLTLQTLSHSQILKFSVMPCAARTLATNFLHAVISRHRQNGNSMLLQMNVVELNLHPLPMSI